MTDHYVRRWCERVLPGIYVRKGAEMTARRRADALALWSRGRVVLAGFSAAAVWGAKWIDPGRNAACNSQYKIRAPAALDIYRDRLEPRDVRLERGMRVTSPARTAFDLGRRLPLGEAVSAVDALYQTGLLTKQQLAGYAHLHPGCHGIRRMRSVIELSDEGSESPQETRTRLEIIGAGLPHPASQRYILGADGLVIGRVDLCWERWRVIVEYDGDGHCTREQLARDIKRHNALRDAGWTLIRVKSDMLDDAALRHEFLEQLRRALRRGGAPV